MKVIREIISLNIDRHPDFTYYEAILDIIEENVNRNPDIAIESCKSLIEGISKSILKALDNTYNSAEVDSLDFQPLFKRMLLKLSEYNSEIESDFVNRACSLIHLLGEIRNKRGDISHGKLAPKEVFSTKQFSNLVSQTTEGITFFVLKHFYSIDLSYQKEVEYKDNMDFNVWLDEANPFGNLSYSKALFQQDNISYVEQLTDYKASQGEI